MRIPHVQRMLEAGAGHPRQARPAARDLPLPRLADARSPRAAGADAGRRRRPQRPHAHARPRLRPAGARPPRGRPFHSGRRPHDGAQGARHLPAAHARRAPSRGSTSPSCRSSPIRCRPSPSSTSPAVRKLQAAMGRVVKYTRPVNYLGLPTLALPVPRNGGLPNGIQLIGRPYARRSCSPSARPTSARCRPRSPGRSADCQGASVCDGAGPSLGSRSWPAIRSRRPSRL